MNIVKLERINNILQREISYILHYLVRDKNIAFVVLTAVNTTNDLSFAKVYFRIHDETKKDEVISSLNKASKFIKSQLYDRVDMRHIPELKFVYDESIDYGQKIEKIIDDLNK
jgi:ribosome-binding factor A